MRNRTRGQVLLLCVAGLIFGCQERDAQPIEEQTTFLTASDIDRVFGFESATVSDWSIIQNGPGTLASSLTHSQGARSLAVAARGYVPVQSIALSSLGSRVSNVVRYDVMLPPEVRQDSPYWYGATQLFVNIPSLAVNNVYLGQVEFTPLPLGRWNTVSFAVPADLMAKLRSSYSDLRFTITINAPVNSRKPVLVDNFRLADMTTVSATVLDAQGNPVAGKTVVVYTGATATPYSGITNSSGVASIPVPPGSYRFGVTESGGTVFSSTTNNCQVPGSCPAATIVDKCGNITCPGADPCGNPGVCDPTAGVCTRVSTQPDGTVCDDGDACTSDERCKSGRCAGGLPVNCPAHTVGTTMLEPPITIAETRTLRDNFSWAATTPLKNFITQGPALYYAIVYVEGKADLQTLDTMDIHYDVLPLFASERQKWMGQTGTLTPGFDGQGGFVFAVIPGFTYNLIREAALCSDPAIAQEAFRAIVLRNIPDPAARNADGTLSYDYLATQGFHYRGLPNCPDTEVATAPGDTEAECDPVTQLPDPATDPEIAAIMSSTSSSGLPLACSQAILTGNQQPWGAGFGKKLKNLATLAAHACQKVVDLGRQALAVGAGLFKGSAVVTVQLQVKNTDEFFGDNTLMTRAWGRGKGQAVPLAGVQVRALQTISFSSPRWQIPSVTVAGYQTPNIMVQVTGTVPFDALATGTANATGAAQIKVVKESATGICVTASNQAARILDWIFPVQVCSFQDPVLSASQVNASASVVAPFQDSRLNILAQLTDAYQYLQSVAGYTPKRADVLVGWAANKLNVEGAAYAPCFGFPNSHDPYRSILSSLQQGVQKAYIEPTLRKAADMASEAFDTLADAVNKWTAAQLVAAGTAAESSINSAAAAMTSSQNAVAAARSAAITAAAAASDLAEAVRKLARYQKEGRPQTDLDAAAAAVDAARSLAATAATLANTAAVASLTAIMGSDAAVATARAAAEAAGGATALAVRQANVATEITKATTAAALDAAAFGAATAANLLGMALVDIVTAVGSDIADLVMANVDIVIPDGMSITSRGVATHEYGHFAFCDMMYRTSPRQFSSAWTDTISTTVSKKALHLDRTNDANIYISEGWADFMSAQIAGGVAYFTPLTSTWAGGDRFDGLFWCRGSARSIEDNFGGAGNVIGTTTLKCGGFDQVVTTEIPFRLNVARIASILHDVFDGNVNANSTTVDAPSNCGLWRVNAEQDHILSDIDTGLNVLADATGLEVAPEAYPANAPLPPHMPEETVAIPGSNIRNIISNWLALEPNNALLQESSFLRGLTTTMTNAGVSTCDICQLYMLHQADNFCPSYATQITSEQCPMTCPPYHLYTPASGDCGSDM